MVHDHQQQQSIGLRLSSRRGGFLKERQSGCAIAGQTAEPGHHPRRPRHRRDGVLRHPRINAVSRFPPSRPRARSMAATARRPFAEGPERASFNVAR
jgi:hypothetical protein